VTGAVSRYLPISKDRRKKKRESPEYRDHSRNVCFLRERWKKMRTVSSYGVEIRKQNIPVRQTMEIYRQAVGYLTEIYAQVWEELRKIPETKKRFNTAEHMVHMTKKNTARFDFDIRFPKMPSYLRRSAIQHALGSVSSYKTRLGQWKETGVLSGRPKLTCRNHAMPVFYRDVMYREGAEGKDEAYLKLYDGHDWKWFRVYLKRTDMEYLRRNWKGKKASAPALEKRHCRYFLRFSYTEEVTLTKTPVKEQIICSVDLGINTDAVCTIMRSDGTVLGRRFIDHPSEKDWMYRTLGRIRRSQREHGSAQTQGRWAYTKRLNTELGKKIACAIVRYAEENQADVIVFEYLEMQGKIPGKKKQKLHLWRKRDIQRRCEHQAHRKEMRISRICAWNTSRLAYDGSGAVTRDRENHSLCTFQTGKRYNCDLSASYNIGARYFIRELLKPLPATERSLLEAKVPPVKRRTSCVYADLRKLHSEMELLKAA
jgi:IS605 OrfB family transposase